METLTGDDSLKVRRGFAALFAEHPLAAARFKGSAGTWRYAEAPK